MSVNRNRVHEVAAFLEGTCGSLDDVTTEAERDDMEFLRELDEQVFCLRLVRLVVCRRGEFRGRYLL
jgi:hypothetical protein